MMSDPYGMAAALEELETENPVLLTWAGGDYKCIMGDRNETKALDIGGFATSADLTVVVRSNQFSSLPAVKDACSIGSRSLSIDSVNHSPCGTFLVLGLNDPTKGV